MKKRQVAHLSSTIHIQYSKVCGQIRGYAFGTLNGFNSPTLQDFNITDIYLDGISITSDDNHIWSSVAMCDDCGPVPSFIGKDWTCDGPGCNERMFCDTLLWDENKCGSTTSWFFKQLSAPSIADIKARVYLNELRPNEDIATTTIELYMQ